MMRAAVLLLACLGLAAPAAAERVVAVVGAERIAITSNFTAPRSCCSARSRPTPAPP